MVTTESFKTCNCQTSTVHSNKSCGELLGTVWGASCDSDAAHVSNLIVMLWLTGLVHSASSVKQPVH